MARFAVLFFLSSGAKGDALKLSFLLSFLEVKTQEKKMAGKNTGKEKKASESAYLTTPAKMCIRNERKKEKKNKIRISFPA
jgi:hypothetical protein